MAEPRIVTSVVAIVAEDRAAELVAGFRELISGERPDGLLRSELLRGEDGRWSIQTLWRDRAAIVAMRASGQPPAAPALFERVGAECTLALFTLEDSTD